MVPDMLPSAFTDWGTPDRPRTSPAAGAGSTAWASSELVVSRAGVGPRGGLEYPQQSGRSPIRSAGERINRKVRVVTNRRLGLAAEEKKESLLGQDAPVRGFLFSACRRVVGLDDPLFGLLE